MTDQREWKDTGHACRTIPLGKRSKRYWAAPWQILANMGMAPEPASPLDRLRH